MLYSKLNTIYTIRKTTGEDPQLSTFSFCDKKGILCWKTSVTFDFKHFKAP